LSEGSRGNLIIAAAIVIAGVLIAASLLFAVSEGTKTSTTTTTTTVIVTSVSTHTLTMTSNGTSTSSVSTSNSSIGLQLSLEQTSYGNGSFKVQVEDFNPLNTGVNVTGTDGWRYGPYFLNPYDNCAPPIPVGFAIAKGHYGSANLSSAQALPLYNTTSITSCSLSIFTGQFEFRPMSDNFTQNSGPGSFQLTDTAQVSFLVSGYYTGGQDTSRPAELIPLGPGEYTIIGADEWGQVLLLYFSVA
jgi:hypothetical protein